MVVSSGTSGFAKEMAIRKRIGNIFNKREEDFPSLKDYNDYLEEVEDMTCSLIEGIDVAVIEAKIAKYQEENAEQIINSRARKAEELAEALRLSKLSNHALAEATDAASGSQVGGVGGAGQYAPAVTGAAFGQPRPTGMIPQLQPVPVGGGHDLPDDEESQKLRAERGGRAGGWTIELSRRRAFEEAFSSMWI
ncbi:hypothetical protein H6P81_007318 [Aristolochia fimbriata]|uniref:MAT1 centre domain-containing protein n=1 Tax=Aristolochia fimbriata TaxID=158543 RepID=A0AAV7F0Y3_ARIFI|nr:hypothetical protein H6P81_007318 [Aristolochia fimbriata]